MQVEKEKVVTIDYTLTDEAGDVLDTSKGGNPLVYLHGAGNLIAGLENALAGKTAGESLKVVLSAEDGYGERDESLLRSVPKEQFGDETLEVGMQFQARTSEGPVLLTVVGIEAESVTLDANHPLAGKPLAFDVTVVDVRAATAEELTHGHVHGDDDHHHH
jgi:FKBP-type peptidyl-prolyl cis-trans isomerase SlyD